MGPVCIDHFVSTTGSFIPAADFQLLQSYEVILDLGVQDVPARPPIDGRPKTCGERSDVDEDLVSGADHVDQFLPARDRGQPGHLVVVRVQDEQVVQGADWNPLDRLGHLAAAVSHA